MLSTYLSIRRLNCVYLKFNDNVESSLLYVGNFGKVFTAMVESSQQSYKSGLFKTCGVI